MEKKIEYIFLVTQDQIKIKVDRRISQMSAVINDALGDNESSDLEDLEEGWPTVPCCLVNKEELDLIITYCSHFEFVKEFDTIPQPIPKGGFDNMGDWLKNDWERMFIQNIKMANLVRLLQSANYLNIPALIELCCATIACLFKD